MSEAESEGDEGYVHVIIINISIKNEIISQKWSEVLSRHIMGRANLSRRAV
jgi:hypothetical protein